MAAAVRRAPAALHSGSGAKGGPGEGYPGPWSVCAWLPGENPTLAGLADPARDAAALAEFIHALQRIDPSEGPPPGAHNFQRGVSLAWRDEWTRDAIAACADLVDAKAVTAAWDVDLHASAWTEPPVWLHGDLAPGNLLAVDGRLSGVIDWGGLGVGDPAIELLPAWNLFEDESRAAYRAALGVDDATWARGRGLALSQAMMALKYYRETNPAVVRWAHRMLAEVLADHTR